MRIEEKFGMTFNAEHGYWMFPGELSKAQAIEWLRNATPRQFLEKYLFIHTPWHGDYDHSDDAPLPTPQRLEMIEAVCHGFLQKCAMNDEWNTALQCLMKMRWAAESSESMRIKATARALEMFDSLTTLNTEKGIALCG